MRNKFDEQLETLNREMINMGELCEHAIETAIKMAMDGASIEMKQDVLDTDSEIDRKEREIENICMKLLLRQQPVARDLRVISSALKMISDMERIGDQASDIVELADYIKNSKAKHKIHLSEMAKEVIKMVTQSIDSFVNNDLYMARSVIISDDVVDNYFYDIKMKLIDLIVCITVIGKTNIKLFFLYKLLQHFNMC